MTTQDKTMGEEIMRVSFSSNPKVHEFKKLFADLFDQVSELAMQASKESEESPGIYSSETIAKHMEVIRRNEEAIRCYAEGSKILETACMYIVKGLTA